MNRELLSLDEMRALKKQHGLTNEMIAERSGVPLGTVQKVLSGITRVPRRETRRAIEQVLLSFEHKTGVLYQSDNLQKGYTVREATAEYAVNRRDARQGSYTIEDYLSTPEDRRVELIDGCFYDMASPRLIHQVILGELHVQFHHCMESHPDCELFMAPSDVRLDRDDRTVVQPDLFIVCGRKDNDRRMVNGAPDLVVEILSPGNRQHDMFLKLNKYRIAGVREYWIVDPETQKVIIYDLERDMPPEVYLFSDIIPVKISKGTCRIDFSVIKERITRYQ